MIRAQKAQATLQMAAAIGLALGAGESVQSTIMRELNLTRRRLSPEERYPPEIMTRIREVDETAEKNIAGRTAFARMMRMKPSGR